MAARKSGCAVGEQLFGVERELFGRRGQDEFFPSTREKYQNSSAREKKTRNLLPTYRCL